jgi:beta-lactamase regulating signal transducer with metallopeptidase domain
VQVWLDRLGATLLDASLAATAITGFVVLAMLQCRQPAHRTGWARTGLLSTLALLPLAALNPVPRIDLRGPIRSLISNSPVGPTHWCTTDCPNSTNRATGAEFTEDNDPDSSPPTSLRRLGRAVVAVYLLGVSIGLGWIGLGLWGTSLLVRRGKPPSSWSLRLYESLPYTARAPRPRLLISEATTRPVLVGSFGPVILIPTDLDEPGASDRLRLSLLHELAHVENLDHRFGPVALLAQTVWFFLPMFWWIRDQLKLDQEFLADRRAVSHFGTSGHYASSLVDLAALSVTSSHACSESAIVQPALPVSGVASALVQRVQMLLKCPFPIEGTTPVWWRWSTALTLTLATLATSCLTLRGLGGWSGPSSSPPEEVSHSFRLPQLVIVPRQHQEPFDLRYRLPDQFTLTLEVMAEPVDLPLLEVLGHRLGPTAIPEAGRLVYRLWHRVQIRRIQGDEFVEVDGQSLLSVSHPSPLASWLTIRPLPGQSTRIRDLRLEW